MTEDMPNRYLSTDWAGGPGEPPKVDVAFLASQHYRPGETEPVLEMRQTDEGPVVLAFSTLDALVFGCGRAQPWIAFPASKLDDVVREAGAVALLWDAVLEPAQRHREES